MRSVRKEVMRPHDNIYDQLVFNTLTRGVGVLNPAHLKYGLVTNRSTQRILNLKKEVFEHIRERIYNNEINS